MRVGIIGGTGKEGSGLAVRWAKAGHDVRIGSRDAERGRETAATLSGEYGVTIGGGDNAWAIAEAEVAVLSVPYSAHRPTLEALKDALKGRILVDITVPLKPPKVRQVNLPEGQAAALEAKAIVGDEVLVAAALHHVGYSHLMDLDHPIPCDVLVCGEKAARQAVLPLVADLGTKALDVGPLRNAIALESLTPLLIHMNVTYKSPGTGIRITGLPE